MEMIHALKAEPYPSNDDEREPTKSLELVHELMARIGCSVN